MKEIREVVESYGVEVRPEGAILRALCPFHGDTGRPNLTLYPETNSWFCYACSDGGDIFKFISKIEGISYYEAKQKEGVNEDKFEISEEKSIEAQIASESMPAQYEVFNDILNESLSPDFRQILYTNPSTLEKVLVLMKEFDQKMQEPVFYDKMVEIKKSLRQELKKMI